MASMFTPTHHHEALGEQLSPWAAGGDAIQVVASHLYAGRPFPRSDLLRAATMLEAYAREARRPGNLGRWTTKDARDLSRMARELRALHGGDGAEANRAGSAQPPISRDRYDEIVRRERAYEAAREQFDPKRFKRGGGYAPEEIAQIERLAGAPAPTNEERGLADQYRWLVDVPENAFLYYDKDMTHVTGWMGDVRGRIFWRGAVQRKLGGGRSQAIRVEGTNGTTYHGVANLTGGTYVRLRLVKSEARALKKLERFIP